MDEPEENTRTLFCTVAEAARRLKITPRAVRLAITEGRLGGELVGHKYMVLVESVEAYVPNGNAKEGRVSRQKRERLCV